MNPLSSPSPYPEAAFDNPAVRRVFGTPRFHADSDVAALAWAADDTLWSVEDSGVLRQWDADGQSLARFFLSDLETLWTFSPDAVWLASASDELLLWEVAAGQMLTSIPQPCWVTAVAFAPDRRLVATGHDDGGVRVWDVATRQAVADFGAHKGPVAALAFRLDGELLASAGEDCLIHLWDLKHRRRHSTLAGHTDRVPALAWHPNGKVLVSAGWDTTARVWDTATGEPLILLNSHAEQVLGVVFSPDGKLLACSDSDNAVHIWDNLMGGQTLQVLRGHGSEIRALAFRGDGERLASAGSDQSVHIWNPRSGELLAGQHTQGRSALALIQHTSPGRLASTCGGTALQAWDLTDGRAVPPTSGAGFGNALAASPDGQYLATGGNDKLIRVWNPATGDLLFTLQGQGGPVAALAFAPNSELIASACGSDGTVWVWNVVTKEVALMIPEAAEGCAVEALAWHPNGQVLACGGIDWLATSGADGAVNLWDMNTRGCVASFERGVSGLAFHPSGDLLAAASLQESALVWELADPEKPPREFGGHREPVSCVAFSPDGATIASGGDDKVLRLWSLADGSLALARQMDTPVKAVVYSADGQTLYTGNGNTTCYQLDVAKLYDE
jgi:WD40 repeat protein